MKKKVKLVTFGWITTVIALFLYSFTQIDLGLTLTRASFWQPIQRKFQLIGYFNRPLSTGLYLAILFLIFGFYFLILLAVKRKWFNSKQIWTLILITAGILWFSYNAFSYDLFNYIFDARIVTFYRQNPYQHKALDYPDDPMLGFMHWTHRLYPYGPLWLVLTVPLSFLGFQKLVPMMILFKGLAVGGYLGASWFIFKILKDINPKEKLIGLVVFAFNPLVIIESLVSAHNDISMMALALAGFWFLVKKKYLPAWLTLGLSIGVKFATALLLPIFILVHLWRPWRKKINWDKVILGTLFLMVLAVLGAIKRDELKPWYLLYPLPFISLLPEKRGSFVFAQDKLFWPMIGLSLGLLLHYAPFLYLGNWNPPVPVIKTKLTFIFLIGGMAMCFLNLIRERTGNFLRKVN